MSHSSIDASALAREARAPARRLVEDAHALTKPGWLVEGLSPELDELRVEHQRVLTQRNDIGWERAAVRRKFEWEEAAHNEELTAAMKEGRKPKLPKLTASDKRQAAFEDVDRRLKAANDALDQFLAEVVAKIEQDTPGWLADIQARLEPAQEQRAEAARLLAQAEAAEQSILNVQQWVERNSGVANNGMYRDIPEVRFVAWDTFTPQPDTHERDAEQHARIAKETNESIQSSLAPGHQHLNPAIATADNQSSTDWAGLSEEQA